MDAGRIGLCIVLAGMLGSVCCGIVLDKTHRFKWVFDANICAKSKKEKKMILLWIKNASFCFWQRNNIIGIHIFDDRHVDLYIHIERWAYLRCVCDIVVAWVSYQVSFILTESSSIEFCCLWHIVLCSVSLWQVICLLVLSLPPN